MQQVQGKESERNVRRKGIFPAGISLGHEVNNFMTVIARFCPIRYIEQRVGWGAIGFYIICMGNYV